MAAESPGGRGSGTARSWIAAPTADDLARARYPLVARLSARALRASAHGNACLAVEHLGRRPAAFEHPINALNARRCGDALAVTGLDWERQRRTDGAPGCVRV